MIVVVGDVVFLLILCDVVVVVVVGCFGENIKINK